MLGRASSSSLFAGGRKRRLLLYFGAGLSALVFAPGMARAQDSTVIAALDTGMRDWMRSHGVPAAALAAIKDGQLVRSFSYGMDPAKPARIASLSKAITAVCVARLIDDGRLSFNAPLGTVLVDAFKRFGQPADPRFKGITIEQLLTHRAGLARDARGGPPAQDMAGTFARVLATPLENNPGGGMSYSNIGYLTLGVIAETVTGTSYERHCGDAALAPMKVSGSIEPQLKARAPN